MNTNLEHDFARQKKLAIVRRMTAFGRKATLYEI